jgi:hypothetical protein
MRNSAIAAMLILAVATAAATAEEPRDRAPFAPIDEKPGSDRDRLPQNFRPPHNEDDLRAWLENMVWHHRFTTAEVRAATGLPEAEVAAAITKFDIRADNKPARSDDAPLLVLPYPGGRHPRIGFREGAVRPQRDTKVSVFTPWDSSSYVVLDVPEAIRCNIGEKRELIYLAHTHTETMWSRQGIELDKLEWQRLEDGSLWMERRLPNDIVFGTKVVPGQRAVWMEVWLTNRSEHLLSRIQVKNCLMLKGAPEFARQTVENKVIQKPFVACRSDRANRWVITGWEHCEKARAKAICPCMHSDPNIADCAPGETKRVRGWLSFYEGHDVESEFRRIKATGWRNQ